MSNVLKNTLCYSMFIVATASHAAEFEVHPSIAVSEEYNDNVFATQSNRITEYTTRTLPGLTLSYKAPVLTGDLFYVFDYRHYARNNHPDETTHSLTTKWHLTAVDNLLFLDINDNYQRVSLDITRDVTRESLFVDQVDRNVVSVSPYFILHPTKRIMLTPGYRYIDTRYFSTSAVEKTDHIAYLDTTYELMNKWKITAGYTFIRELAVVDNFSQHQALGGLRYEYADKSFIFAQGGNTWIEYDSGQRLNSKLWNAGLTHVFDTTTVTVTTGVKYDEDPLRNITRENFVNGNIEQGFKRGSVGFSLGYSEYVLTTIDPVKTKKYGATARGQYEFTVDVSGNLAFTAEKYELPLQVQGSSIKHLQIDSGLSYLLAEKLTASLTYIYAQYTSPGITSNNYHVNRGMIEIRKTF